MAKLCPCLEKPGINKEVKFVCFNPGEHVNIWNFDDSDDTLVNENGNMLIDRVNEFFDACENLDV